jgi:hypothetical protein
VEDRFLSCTEGGGLLSELYKLLASGDWQAVYVITAQSGGKGDDRRGTPAIAFDTEHVAQITEEYDPSVI